MITIITPTFDSEKFIELQYHRLKPILSDVLRWLIIDDCSNDNTRECIEQLQDPFVNYHRLNKNSGPSVARHIGALLAQTKFLFFLDADDMLFNTEFLEFCDFICKNDTNDFFYAQAYISNVVPHEGKIKFKEIKESVVIKRPTDFIYYGMPNYSSLAVRKDFFCTKVKENNLSWGEDIVSYLQMSQSGIGMKWIKPVSCYIIHGNGRGSALSLLKRFKLFKYLIIECFKNPRKINAFLFSVYLIIRYICSFIYKKTRG